MFDSNGTKSDAFKSKILLIIVDKTINAVFKISVLKDKKTKTNKKIR